jgi:hypothetical protein
MAAQTLVEAGKQVAMVDVGMVSDTDTSIPDKDYLDIRKNDVDQYKYLVGENASNVMWGKVGKGEQLTPPRMHIIKGVERFIPLQSDSFTSLESLGYGGLGIGWGLQCWEYSKADLQQAGLNVAAMTKAYRVVGDRIGISATRDDAAKYTIGSLKSYDKSPAMDRNHSLILNRYNAKKRSLNKKGFFLGRTPLALITKSLGKRKGYTYRDMDFYSDNDQSAWRPWITVNELRQKKNFSYIGGHLVLSFTEQKNYITVTCLLVETGKTVTLRCRRLVLASSALGSARIVLRSLGEKNTKLPILCNPYSYIPCVQPRLLGKAAEPKKLGFTQLSLFLDPDHSNSQTSVASLYGYQSLMLFRIIRHVPLNFLDARILMRYLLSGIVIMGIHHPDSRSDEKYLELTPSKTSPTGDVLSAHYQLSDFETARNHKREAKFIKTLRKLGTFSIKRMDPGSGASIHYAGTLPYSQDDKPFTLAASGRLHRTKHVYVADSSGFNYLPAPGLTFSLMANAHLVAEYASRDV